MRPATVVPPLLTLAACLAVWILRTELAGFRGGLVWDLRYVVLAIGAVLLLSLAERTAQWVAARLP